MKTVVTQLIDGKNIVTGFGTPVINPEASKLVISVLLAATAESIAVASKFDEIAVIQQLAKNSLNAARSLPMGTEKELKNAEYRNYLDAAQVKTNAELKPLNNDLRLKAEELWSSSSVIYFEPKLGEFIITTPEFDALKVQYPIPPAKALEFDSVAKTGTIIDDLKGVNYWINTAGVWSTNVVTSIGMALPVDAIAEADLSTVQQTAINDQLEEERILGLTQVEKDAEKQIAIDNATANAVNLRSQYELQGSTPSVALADAQTWLTAEIVIIEAKYA